MVLFRHLLMYTTFFSLLICTLPATGAEADKASGLITQKSDQTMEETVATLQQAIKDRGLRLFAVIDHSANAKNAGMELPPTTVVVFGNPKLGTPLMQEQRTIAIDLPQKMLVWEEGEGQVFIAYNSVDYISQRHNIAGDLQKIADALEGLAKTAVGKQ
ncbi:MAG: DUF302 domain-containing protein [Desulforhopalus sp.]